MVREEVDVQGTLDYSSRWWKNADGTKVHRSDCRYAKVPFSQAAYWTDDRMRHYVETLFYVSSCSACWKDGP